MRGDSPEVRRNIYIKLATSFYVIYYRLTKRLTNHLTKWQNFGRKKIQKNLHISKKSSTFVA